MPSHASAPTTASIRSAICATNSASLRARLRFYEDEALIAPERRGTQRLYSERDRARLAWILRGKRVGLSLADIKELLDLYDIGDGRRTQRSRPSSDARSRSTTLKHQRIDIDATIKELEGFIALVKAQTPNAKRSRSMPVYTAPVRDTQYRARPCRRHPELLQSAGLRRRHAGFGRGDPDEGARFCEEVLQPLNRVGDEAGLQAQRRRIGDHSAGLQGGLGPVRRRRLDDTCMRRRNMAGQGLPSVVADRDRRISRLGQPWLRNVQRPDPGRDRLAAGQGIGRAEGANICRTWSPAAGPGR